MIKLTGIMQTFEPIFERMEITHSQEASLYYVFSISDHSLNFTETLREARKIRRTISQRALLKGRDYLLKKGLLAKVLFTHDGEDEIEQKSNNYIPVHPRIIFEGNEEYLREIYEPEDFSVRKKQVEDFYSIYEINYGKYGLKLEKGCVTLYCSNAWIISYIASIMARKDVNVKVISMILSGFRLFKPQYRRYYEDKMRKDLEMRIIFGSEEDIEEIEEIKALRNVHEEHIEIKYTPNISRTSKSFIIDDKLAMDGRKILMNGEEPSYIGTMYIEEKGCIKSLGRDFENIWKMSKALI